MSYGEYATVCSNDADRKIATAFLRQTTGAAETKTHVRQLETRFRGTPNEVKNARVDRGPEFIGAKKVSEFKPGGKAGSDVIEAMLGPTGNLRAPTLRVGKTVVVGFNEDVYSDVLL